jgi:hypothetical protein
MDAILISGDVFYGAHDPRTYDIPPTVGIDLSTKK